MFNFLPRLSYNLSRDFPWRIEPLVYLLLLFVIGVLIPLNIAKAGYDNVTVLEPDFDWVPHHWYDKFGRAPKAGSLCDPYRFNLGDALTTNSSIFTWTLTSIFNKNQTKGAINPSNTDYNGWSLVYCDATYLSLVIDARTSTTTIAAEVTCIPDPTITKSRYNLVMSTSIDIGWTYSTTVGNGQKAYSDLSWDASVLLDEASDDAQSNVMDVIAAVTDGSPVPTYIAVDTAADTISCVPDQSTTEASCLNDPPTITLNEWIMITSNAHILNDTEVAALPSGYEYPVKNFMQIMLALVRLDIGRALNNNVLVNPSIIDQIIMQNYTVSGATTPTSLYADLTDPNTDSVGYALRSDNRTQLGQTPSPFQVQYSCQDKTIKDGWSLFIAVAVATLTLFKGVYALVIKGLTIVAKRQAGADEGVHEEEMAPSESSRDSEKQDLEA